MISVEGVKGAHKEEVEKAMKDKFFSDVTGIVEFVHNVIDPKLHVCFKYDHIGC